MANGKVDVRPGLVTDLLELADGCKVRYDANQKLRAEIRERAAAFLEKVIADLSPFLPALSEDWNLNKDGTRQIRAFRVFTHIERCDGEEGEGDYDGYLVFISPSGDLLVYWVDGSWSNLDGSDYWWANRADDYRIIDFVDRFDIALILNTIYAHVQSRLNALLAEAEQLDAELRRVKKITQGGA